MPRLRTENLSDLPAEFLVRRLKHCDQKWDQAMRHPKYRDEPTEEEPFSEEDWLFFNLASRWRDRFHEYEEALYRQRDTVHGLLEGLSVREPATVYESTND